MHQRFFQSLAVSTPLVGREAHLNTISRLLAARLTGQATTSVVMLRGEAGIGKTRLLRTLQEQALGAAGISLKAHASSTRRVCRTPRSTICCAWLGHHQGAISAT